MNSKQSKQLRKMAKVIAGQAIAAGQEIYAKGYHEIERNRKMIRIPSRNEDGTLNITKTTLADGTVQETQTYENVPISTGTVLNGSNTIRGIYRRMKKLVLKAGITQQQIEQQFNPTQTPA